MEFIIIIIDLFNFKFIYLRFIIKANNFNFMMIIIKFKPNFLIIIAIIIITIIIKFKRIIDYCLYLKFKVEYFKYYYFLIL
jgi:hypothetical protein